MTTDHAAEFRMFTAVQHELHEALRMNDTETASLALEEIHCISMHTGWPRLRQAAAALVNRHSQYADNISCAV